MLTKKEILKLAFHISKFGEAGLNVILGVNYGALVKECNKNDFKELKKSFDAIILESKYSSNKHSTEVLETFLELKNKTITQSRVIINEILNKL